MNAMNVRVAARKDTRDDIRVTVMWVEKLSRNAKKDTAAATGRTARPLVQDDLIVTVSVLWRAREYP